MAYLNKEYKKSVAYSTVMAITSNEQLDNRKKYTKNAIDFHSKEKNESQIIFFNEDLKHIEIRRKQIK